MSISASASLSSHRLPESGNATAEPDQYRRIFETMIEFCGFPPSAVGPWALRRDVERISYKDCERACVSSWIRKPKAACPGCAEWPPLFVQPVSAHGPGRRYKPASVHHKVDTTIYTPPLRATAKFSFFLGDVFPDLVVVVYRLGGGRPPQSIHHHQSPGNGDDFWLP